MRAELLKGRIVMDTEYRERDLVKSIPGAKYDKDTREWSVPVSWANCLCIRGVFGVENMEIGPELRAWAQREITCRVKPATDARNLAMDMEADVPGPEDAYRFQRTGIAFLAASEGAILADEMGTGKTMQSLLTVEALNTYPLLVVCPKGLRGTWAHECEQWIPNRKTVVLDGNMPKRRKLLEEGADVFIINYDLMKSHSRLKPYGSIALTEAQKTPGELNRPWGSMICDEAHKIKDASSVQTRATKAVGASAVVRFALTGTPVANDPADFWSLLNFVSPNEWPSKSKFVDRYCLTAWNAFGGMDVVGIRAEMRDEFFQVVDPRFLRRTKEQVLPQLPPKIRITRKVELKGKQKKAYEEMRDGQATALSGGELVSFNALTTLTRLSQFAAAHAELDADGGVVLSEPSTKLDELMDLIEELDGEPLVVFAASRQLIELASARLVKKGLNHGLITGAVSPEDREWAKEAFQDGRIKLILLTLGAGAEGLTLTAARHLCFLQRSWSLVQNKQAEDRIHRIGAEKHESVFIIDIQTMDTVEEDVVDRLEEKYEMLQQIARDPISLKEFIHG